MESIDRNDVNISILFNWGKEFILYDENRKELFKVYLRIIGDSDLNKAKVYALRKSAEMRKKLKSKKHNLLVVPQSAHEWLLDDHEFANGV